MKHSFTLLSIAVLWVLAGASAQAAPGSQDTLAEASSADISVEQTSTTPGAPLLETADADATGKTGDLDAKAHLDIRSGDAASASRHPALLEDNNDSAPGSPTPGSGQVGSTPHVPEPSSQTALYVLGGAVGLGFVVMRRRPLA